MTYLYCLIHTHQFGSTSYFFYSDKKYSSITKSLAKKLIDTFNIDFQPDCESLDLYIEKSADVVPLY